MSLREHLQGIYEQHGRITPALVVDAARPQNAPLHDRFEWDDSTAGESWRRQQAHQLIRSVRVVYRDATESEPPAEIRAWQAVRTEEGHVYQPADKVATDVVLSRIVLNDMEREWRQMHRRYGHFQEFVAMVTASLDDAGEAVAS